ncbi:MAG: complex I NDUFA9 subunit family protein [Bordetella sp.]|nr:MAG: complex I NDUFA9 subunit family protein [Bordetella sp.]
MQILILGGTGFVGQNLIAQLSNNCENQLVIPIRKYNKARNLKVFPSVNLTESNIYDDIILEQLISESDIVINLVGTLYAGKQNKWPYNEEFFKIHVELPKRIAIACRKYGVRRFLHFSAIGSNSNGPSMYLRSKGDGEKVIYETFANSNKESWTILQPSLIFGPNDKLTNRFANLAKWLPFIPIVSSNTKIQPIYVNDIGNFISYILDSEIGMNKVYELGGQKIYSLKEFVRLCAVYSGHPKKIYSISKRFEYLQAYLFEFLPWINFLSRDILNSLSVDSVISNSELLKDLNFSFSNFESIAPTYLNKT